MRWLFLAWVCVGGVYSLAYLLAQLVIHLFIHPFIHEPFIPDRQIKSH
jgi:hypothetical protein